MVPIDVFALNSCWECVFVYESINVTLYIVLCYHHCLLDSSHSVHCILYFYVSSSAVYVSWSTTRLFYCHITIPYNARIFVNTLYIHYIPWVFYVPTFSNKICFGHYCLWIIQVCALDGHILCSCN